MRTQDKLLSAAERLFDNHGFTATGMDAVARAAQMSSRTLYKQAGSKTALVSAVLAEREARFLARMQEVCSVPALFDALSAWMRDEGSRGCLFLRAYGETGGDVPDIAEAVLRHKRTFAERIQDIVAIETGIAGDSTLARQILVLFEGALAAAVYRGVDAVADAREAAIVLTSRER